MKRQSETDWARIDQMVDEEIDTADIPPLDDAFFAAAQWWVPGKKTDVANSDGAGLRSQSDGTPFRG
jgi:hypothetical protein